MVDRIRTPKGILGLIPRIGEWCFTWQGEIKVADEIKVAHEKRNYPLFSSGCNVIPRVPIKGRERQDSQCDRVRYEKNLTGHCWL